MEAWGPVRKWFEEQYGEVGVSLGINPPVHPEETVARVQAELETKDQWDLALLEVSTRYAKSLICSMKFLANEEVTAEQVMKWALLEENFQIERCGLVEGDHDVFRDDMFKWLTAAKEFKIIIDSDK
jgi:chaperone required for assembly of F1-ATPase